MPVKIIEPHPSHKMTDWKGSIVTLCATSRFGKIRKCTECGAEQAQTVSGEKHHSELMYVCSAVEGTKEVEYYRCWADGTWDTGMIEVDANVPPFEMFDAIQDACSRLEWKDGIRPVFVGLYHIPNCGPATAT